MKTGILGGTFDPVHLGHITIAENVRDELSLDEVLLIPAGVPMSRPNDRVTTASHRLNMVEIAVKGKKALKATPIEIERPGPTYTVDTLEELRKRGNEDDEIYFVLGSDTLQTIGTWKNPGRILELCRLVVVPRPGYQPLSDEELEKILPGLSKNIIVMKGPYLDISASQIRKRIAEGKPISHLVPEGIEEYIRQHNLYRREQK
jgi:nicotinate-nucleotide adenylyltransferase